MKKIILFILILSSTFIVFNLSFAQMTWNHACQFVGDSNKYVAVPHSASLNITGSFTIEAWVNPVNVNSPGAQIILQKRAATSTGYTLYLSSGKIAIRNNSSTRLVGKTPIPNNQWTHIAGSYSSTLGIFRVFINGNQDTTSTVAGVAPISNTDSVLIGVGSNEPFNGLMDEVRIWNVALTSTDIQQLFRMSLGTNSGFYSGLVMSLTFQKQDPSGSPFSLLDWSGNNNTAFNRGLTGFSMYDNPSSTISINECVTLDGTGDYLAGPDQSSVSPTSGITLETWVYPRSFNANSNIYSTIIHKGNSAGSVMDYGVSINLRKFQFSINETNVFSLSTSGEFFPLNQWTHVAITYSGSDGFMKFILNGELRWDDTNFVGNIHDNTDSVYIGGTANQQCFDGYIDEVRITSSALSYEEVSNNVYNSRNELNDASSTNVVYNLDGSLISNSDTGPRLSLRGNSRFSQNAFFSDIPVSPMSFSSGLNFSKGYYMSNSHVRIPSSGPSGFMISDTINVPLSEVISDVNVFVGLNHTDEDNLVLSLISPSGTAVTLYSTTALINNSDNLNTIFNDDSDSSLASGKYVMYLPRIKPLNNLDPVFSGTDTKGKWKLRIQDVANSDTGRLYGWGIQFNNHSQRKKVLSLTTLIQGFYNSATNLMIPDTMKVTIRNGTSPYNIFETVKRKLSDSGKADFVFNSVPDGVPVYIQLQHRNSIETWSRKPSSGSFALLFSTQFQPLTSFLNFNFTTSSSTAFGGNQTQVDTGPNKFAIYSGDVNQNGSVDAVDLSLVDNDAFVFATGYVNTDVNGDGNVDSGDLGIIDNNAFNFVSKLTPP